MSRRVLPAALLALLAACDPAPSPGEERLAVVERDLHWAREPGARAPQAHTLEWSMEGRDAWRPAQGTVATPHAEGLLLRGTDGVSLESPPGTPLDPALHHHLVVVLRSAGPLDAVVRWSTAPGEGFHESRSTVPERLQLTEDWTVWSIPVASLRGWSHQKHGRKGWFKAADATEGLHRIAIDFRSPAPGGVSVSVDSIAVVSEFDGEAEAPPPPRRLGREQVFLRGTAMGVGDRISAPIEPGPRDRLRFQLALAGGHGPVHVRLSDTRGALPVSSWELRPGDPWRPVALSLAALEGRPTRLVLETWGEAGRAAVLIGGVMRLAPAATPRPDVILYVEDTLRADHLGAYGHERDTSPALDAIAREGVLFEHVIAASNWTRPATTTLLSSLDPLRHGIQTDFDRAGSDLVTLAEAFADAGYVTASFVTNYHAGEWAGLDQGFDVASEPPAYGASYMQSTLTSAAVTEPLIALLERHVGERLFVYVHTLDPHSPYRPRMEELQALFPDEIDAMAMGLPPPGASELDALELARRRYEAEILHNDRRVAELDAALGRLGTRDHTLFAFTSDHGEAFGEHGVRSHREELFQEELHVPWILRWPAGLPVGRRVGRVVTHLDVAPTLAGLARVPTPVSWRGRDLTPLAQGEHEPDTDPPILVHVVYGEPRAGGQREALAVVRWPYKLTTWVSDAGEIQPRALFRLDTDPAEQHDLSEHPEARAVIEELAAWARAERASAARNESAERSRRADPAMQAWLEAMGYVGGDGH